MSYILEQFDNIVTNVANSYRLQEECDLEVVESSVVGSGSKKPWEKLKRNGLVLSLIATFLNQSLGERRQSRFCLFLASNHQSGKHF